MRPPIPPRVREILDIIAVRHQVTVEDILSPLTTRTISAARQEAYYALSQARTAAGRRPSLSEVGRWIGDRDHTTVAYGITRHLNPDDKRPASIAVLMALGERQNMTNVLPVDPETQARVLAQFFSMRRKQG